MNPAITHWQGGRNGGGIPVLQDGAIWLRRKRIRKEYFRVRIEQKEIFCILSSVWIQGAREEEGLLSLVFCWC